MERDIPKMGFELYSAPHKARELLAAHSHTLPCHHLPDPPSKEACWDTQNCAGKPMEAKGPGAGWTGVYIQTQPQPLVLGKVLALSGSEAGLDRPEGLRAQNLDSLES